MSSTILPKHPAPGTAVDPDTFRQLCGCFATGVVIVTTRDSRGVPYGMTVNSFASISLEPPLISFAISHEAAILPLLQQGLAFTVNVLSAQQEAFSRRFASGVSDRFEGVDWTSGPEGEIILEGTLAQLHCQPWGELAAGDHTILIGQVSGGQAALEGQPLLFFRSSYTGSVGS